MFDYPRLSLYRLCCWFCKQSGIYQAGELQSEAATLKEKKDRISDSIYYQIGGDFLRQSQDINPELVLKGIEDALAGTNTRMPPGEMEKTLTQLQDKQ